MDPKPPAWKSVYTSSSPTSKQHKHVIKLGNKAAAQPGVCNQSGKQDFTLHTTAANAQQLHAAAAVPASDRTPSQHHTSGGRQSNSRPVSSRPAAPGRHKRLSVPVDTATQAQQCSPTPCSASRLWTPQQQPAVDNPDHAVQGAVSCSNGSVTGPNSATCCKRLSSPPQPQSKPAAAQHLSPYLASFPLTARRPRSPGCPRPSSPLSGLSRAARNTESDVTTTTITRSSIILGNSAHIFASHGSSTSVRHSSGRNRLHSQQQSNRVAAFKIQVNYGPRPAAVAAASKAAIASDSATISAACGANEEAGVSGAAASPSMAAAPPAAAMAPTTVAVLGEVAEHVQDMSCSCGHLEEPVEQGLGMMLSEYILQMHTTPVACNSVSGLGDESDYEDADVQQSPSSRPHFSNSGSILASWGMQTSESATVAAATDPIPPMFAGEGQLATPECVSGKASEADATSTHIAMVPIIIAHQCAVQLSALGSPFAAAAATQRGSTSQHYSSSPRAAESSAQGSWQQVLVCESNNSFNSCSSADGVTSDLGFDPRDCTPDAGIIGSGSNSSCSSDLDNAYQASPAGQNAASKASAAPAALLRGPSAGMAAARQAGNSTQQGAEAAAVSSMRPQSSAGRRGVPVLLKSPAKELSTGQRPSGFLMASANSLDLQPATASVSIRSSRNFEVSTAATGAMSSRSLTGCQQQRSFTDLDSSSEGFVREVSLGHLSAPLFTPSGTDASVRMPLQHLWGSCDTVSAHSSFSSRAGNQQLVEQEQQQQQKRPGMEDAAEVAASRPDSCPQQPQYRSSSPQKTLTPTRPQKGTIAGGFLQRLTGGRDAATASAYQPTAALAAPGWLDSSSGDHGNDCKGTATVIEPGQPLTGVTPRVPGKLGGYTVVDGARAAILDADVEEYSADDISPSAAIAVSTAAHAPEKKFLLSAFGSSSAAGVAAVMHAWVAPVRPASHKSPAATGQMQPQLDNQQVKTAYQEHSRWEACSGRRTQQVTADAFGSSSLLRAAAADVKQRPHSAAAAACSMHIPTADESQDGTAAHAICSVELLEQPWSERLQCQQQMHRPPSRQKPPAEALHLFTSFLDQ